MTCYRFYSANGNSSRQSSRSLTLRRQKTLEKDGIFNSKDTNYSLTQPRHPKPNLLQQSRYLGVKNLSKEQEKLFFVNSFYFLLISYI